MLIEYPIIKFPVAKVFLKWLMWDLIFLVIPLALGMVFNSALILIISALFYCYVAITQAKYQIKRRVNILLKVVSPVVGILSFLGGGGLINHNLNKTIFNLFNKSNPLRFNNLFIMILFSASVFLLLKAIVDYQQFKTKHKERLK